MTSHPVLHALSKIWKKGVQKPKKKEETGNSMFLTLSMEFISLIRQDNLIF